MQQSETMVEKSREIFFCYAREDEEFRQSLEKQLRALRRQGLITLWHDRQIPPGTEWEGEINRHLNSAQIILLLVSPDFIDSDYCFGIEMRRAMERHQRGEARVIPVILRPTLWQGAPFGKLQALPTDAIPVTSKKWHNQDEAFFTIAEGIKKVIEDFFSPARENILQSQQNMRDVSQSPSPQSFQQVSTPLAAPSQPFAQTSSVISPSSPMKPSSEVAQPSRWRRALSLAFLLFEAVMWMRFLLKLIGADPNNLFAGFLYALTDIILFPFSTILRSPSLHPPYQAFEWSTLLAIGIYSFLFWIVLRWFSVGIFDGIIHHKR